MTVINTQTILHNTILNAVKRDNAILNAVKNLTHRLIERFFTSFIISVFIAFRIVVSIPFRIELNKKVGLCFRLLEKTIFVQIKHIL